MGSFIKDKLKKLYSEYFSLIFFPNNGKPFFEMKLKKLYIYLFIFVLLSTSIYSVFMTDTTSSLYSLLTTKVSRSNSLKSATQNQKKHINNLEKEFNQINNKILYLSELDYNVRSMVGLTTTIDKLEVNRSLDRNINFDTIGEVKQAETINSHLDNKIEEMNTLVDDVEKRLRYLECYPDKWPTYGRISSNFGYRVHPITKTKDFHTGIDIANSSRTSIYAAGSGKVIFSGYRNGYGKTIIIDHGYGYVTLYAHNSSLLVERGDRITKGDKIAKMGRTGSSTGIHLHFEVRKYGTQIDPTKVLK